jgi:sigma-B regulation protein RsbU (phosphoserine phosphatase)
VSGHGVGSALLAVTVLNVLSHRALPETDFGDPAAVMAGLNGIFEMERHGGKFFTVWYGVCHLDSRRLTFSGGGHPPTLLRSGADGGKQGVQELSTPGPIIGLPDMMPFENVTIDLPPDASLLLYSDGAVEVGDSGGKMANQDDFTQFAGTQPNWDGIMEKVIDRARTLRGQPILDDDCSLLLVRL